MQYTKRLKQLSTIISKLGTHILWVGFLLTILGYEIYSNYGFTKYDFVVGLIFAIFTFTTGEILRRKLDLNLKNRANRTKFLGIIISGWFLITFITWNLISDPIKNALIIALSTITIILINNIFYRISMHVALTTSLLILINYFSGWSLIWIFIVVPLIGWSRVYLKKHTLSQVVMGFLVPFIAYQFLNFLELI